MDAAQFIARAREALATPTLYRLGAGGHYGTDSGPRARPGVEANVQATLASLDADKRTRYEHEAHAAGIRLQDLPQTMPFCDCSGYVCWALGIPRAPAPDARSGWVWTHSIYEDALRPGGLFRREDSAQAPLTCRAGALLVYPKAPGEEAGHVGIVSQVDDAGRPLQVLHCASQNFLLAQPGRPHSAIAETGPQVFLEHLQAPRPSIAVWFGALQA